MESRKEPVHVTTVKIPASFIDRLDKHKGRTGETCTQVLIEGAKLYLDQYDREHPEKSA